MMWPFSSILCSSSPYYDASLSAVTVVDMAHTISELAGVHDACDATVVSLSVLSFITGSWQLACSVNSFKFHLRVV
jgi:hypothetical protein